MFDGLSIAYNYHLSQCPLLKTLPGTRVASRGQDRAKRLIIGELQMSHVVSTRIEGFKMFGKEHVRSFLVIQTTLVLSILKYRFHIEINKAMKFQTCLTC